MLGMGGVLTGRLVASKRVVTAQLFGREDGPLREMRPEVHGVQLPVNRACRVMEVGGLGQRFQPKEPQGLILG